MNTETNRYEFEEWVTAMPYERDITRRPNDSEKYAFPNTYVDYYVDLAWEAWQAARERHTPISDEAIESACDVLDDNIQSCDSGESDQERMLQEARDYLWSMHFSNNPPTSEKI
jgi:hypothetical protein